MRKIIYTFLIFIPALVVFGQTSKSTLKEPKLTVKLQSIKDNIDNMFTTFKSDKQPDPEVNFDDSFITTLRLYDVPGSVSTNNFDNNLSFRISSTDFKKATKQDFENAYNEIAAQLRIMYDDLEIRTIETDSKKQITCFDAGKDTEAPVASPESPKHYISLKYSIEKVGTKTSYSIFLYFTTKK